MKKLLLVSLCALFFSTIAFAQSIEEVKSWDWRGFRGLPNDQLVKASIINDEIPEISIDVDVYISRPLYGTTTMGSPYNPSGSISVWAIIKHPNGEISHHDVTADIVKDPNTWESYAGAVRPGRPLKKTISITYKSVFIYPNLHKRQVEKFPPVIKVN